MIAEFNALLPAEVRALHQESHLETIVPWFMESLDVPGDIAEFGCFRGALSVKFATIVKAIGSHKTVYAFDTFTGFAYDDPSGGTTRAGKYAEDGIQLTLRGLSLSLPLYVVAGDAVETCHVLDKPLSFIWLDLDYAELMEPILDTIWSLLQPRTIIGIDDVGLRDTPSVKPWVDGLISAGRLKQLYWCGDALGNWPSIGFYHPII